MIVKAEQKNLRQTPTRLRLVAEAIKHLSPKDAMNQLTFMNKKAARALLNVMKQAMANATNNMGLSADLLEIKEIIVGEGPRYKRFRAVSRGRAHAILKRTAHVKVLLESKEEAKQKKGQKAVEAKKETVAKETKKVEQTVKPVMPTLQRTAKVNVKTQKAVRPVAMRKTGER